MKYVKGKPVRDLAGDQFLKLWIAHEDKLLEVTISDQITGHTASSYVEEIKTLYYRVGITRASITNFSVPCFFQK